MSGLSRGGGQIPLPFFAAERLEFASYWPGPNQEVLLQLQRVAEHAASQDIYLWGEPGAGKSHLLQAACNHAARRGLRSAYVPLAQRRAFRPELLEGLEQLDLVCVDDLDAIAGDPEWEQALFNLYNRLHDAQRPLITAAGAAPAALRIQLGDLASRLSAGLIYRLAPLDEPGRLAALRHRAALRGLSMPDDVLQFLARRIGRDMNTLCSWLERLDRASLAAQKKLTVPFVSGLLEAEKSEK